MSNAVFPTLPGLTFGVSRAPQFQTKSQRAVSGRELRATFQQYPLYTFTLSYEFLRGDATVEFQTLVGFFLARQGSFDSFLFTDPDDNAASAMPFGVGNGSTTQFQLSRDFGAGGFTFTEPVQNVNGAPQIYVNGVLKTVTTDYTISSTGLVTFTSAPAAAAPLTWTGAFYYRCRFVNDSAEMSKFMTKLWEAKKVELVGAIGNKI